LLNDQSRMIAAKHDIGAARITSSVRISIRAAKADIVEAIAIDVASGSKRPTCVTLVAEATEPKSACAIKCIQAKGGETVIAPKYNENFAITL